MCELAACVQFHLILWTIQEGSYYDLPFTNKEIKAQECWDVLKGTQLVRSKGSNQVFLSYLVVSHPYILRQALYVRMAGGSLLKKLGMWKGLPPNFPQISYHL
jgi:hypothetical protein